MVARRTKPATGESKFFHHASKHSRRLHATPIREIYPSCIDPAVARQRSLLGATPRPSIGFSRAQPGTCCPCFQRAHRYGAGSFDPHKWLDLPTSASHLERHPRCRCAYPDDRHSPETGRAPVIPNPQRTGRLLFDRPVAHYFDALAARLATIVSGGDARRNNFSGLVYQIETTL